MTDEERGQFGELFRGGDHWTLCDLGEKWREAGDALAGSYPEAARRAYAWSLYYLELYNRAWTAHLPASRWDNDGGLDMQDVQRLMDALPGGQPETPVSAWVDALIAGDWQRALAALGDDVPALEFKPLVGLLADACHAADREEDVRRLLNLA